MTTNYNELNLCFIIACKIYNNYKCYLPFYVSKIKEYYPNALTILVDNNSKNPEIFKTLKNQENVIVIENTSDSKFEVGAYKIATEYIKINNLKYNYYICTQDTFILVNKYDFNILKNNNINCAAISHFNWKEVGNNIINNHFKVLTYLNLYDPNEIFMGCWAASWVCNHSSLIIIYNLLKDIKPIIRQDSEQTERYMGKILKMLNNGINFSIENSIMGENYDIYNIEPILEKKIIVNNYFVKHSQGKTENT
jgi:hypothetical protein